MFNGSSAYGGNGAFSKTSCMSADGDGAVDTTLPILFRLLLPVRDATLRKW